MRTFILRMSAAGEVWRFATSNRLSVKQYPLCYYTHRAIDGTLDLHHLESLLSPKTRVVAFTLASNHMGTVTPVAEIVRHAHSVGALAW